MSFAWMCNGIQTTRKIKFRVSSPSPAHSTLREHTQFTFALMSLCTVSKADFLIFSLFAIVSGLSPSSRNLAVSAGRHGYHHFIPSSTSFISDASFSDRAVPRRPRTPRDLAGAPRQSYRCATCVPVCWPGRRCSRFLFVLADLANLATPCSSCLAAWRPYMLATTNGQPRPSCIPPCMFLQTALRLLLRAAVYEGAPL